MRKPLCCPDCGWRLIRDRFGHTRHMHSNSMFCIPDERKSWATTVTARQQAALDERPLITL